MINGTINQITTTKLNLDFIKLIDNILIILYLNEFFFVDFLLLKFFYENFKLFRVS